VSNACLPFSTFSGTTPARFVAADLDKSDALSPQEFAAARWVLQVK